MTRKTPSRILLTGGCQIGGIAAALRILLPGAQITFSTWPELQDVSRHDEHAGAFASADMWVSERPPPALSALDRSFPEHPSCFQEIPTLYFTGLHPDISRATSRRTQQLLAGPNGDPYCSALVYWGWKNRWQPADIAALFRPETFRALGYVDAWAPAIARLRADFARCDIPSEAFLLRIRRAGNFMHTDNHPRIVALAALACELALLLGASPEARADPITDFLDDGLGWISWPVYPGIAEHYGLKGLYRWRFCNSIVHGVDEYVRMALDAYRDQDPAEYECALGDSPIYDEVLAGSTRSSP